MWWVVSLIVAIAAIALLGLGIRFVEDLENENQSIEEQLRSTRMYDKALDERMKEVQRFRHDINGLLQAVEFARYAAGGESSSLADFASALPLVDAVLRLKRHQCEEAGIAFSHDVDDGFARRVVENRISESDLCVVVQNLLQNAYEASSLVEPLSDRVVRLAMQVRDERAGIVVENRIAQDEVPTFRTTKQDAERHGIGLGAVSEVAKKYGGCVRHDFDPALRMLTMHVDLGSAIFQIPCSDS